MVNKKKKIWQYPWLFTESFAVSFALIIIGVILEIINHGKRITSLVFPENVFVIIILIALITLLFCFYKKHFLIKWLTSIPAAASVIVILVFLSLLMVVFPQNDSINSSFLKLTGLSHIFQSYEFVLSCLYLIIILGFTIVKRIFYFKYRSIGFILNHLGLWIIIVSGLLGSGDLKNLNLYCYQNKPTNKGFNKSMKMYSTPFKLQLIKFDIEEYAPHLVLFNPKTCKVFDDKNNFQYEIIQNKKYTFNNYEIIICKFLKESIYNDSDFIQSNEAGYCSSALLLIKNLKSNMIINGWVTCGSYKLSPVFIQIDENYAVSISKPEPKKFISILKIINDDGSIKNAKIEVNKPFSFNEWKLYQLSYDTQKGKFSDYSIIQAVYNPWLKYTYTGIFLLIAGSIFLLIQFNDFKKL